MAYRCLFFDLDNTLWDCDANAKAVLLELYDQYGIGAWFPSPNAFYDAYKSNNDRLWRAFAQGRVFKPELNRERFLAPFRGKMPEPEAEQLAARVCADFMARLVLETRVMPGALELLDYLKSRRYRMFVVSNGFSEVQYGKLRHSGLAPYFERVFLSEDLREHKPDKRFFDLAVMSANARKAESLVIGDNFDADIVGAHAARIPQVYYEPVPREGVRPFEPTYHIHDLLELKTIL